MEIDVAKNLHDVLDILPNGVRLVAISKYHPNEYLEAAYNEGQRIFGESHEQELSKKYETLARNPFLASINGCHHAHKLRRMEYQPW